MTVLVGEKGLTGRSSNRATLRQLLPVQAICFRSVGPVAYIETTTKGVFRIYKTLLLDVVLLLCGAGCLTWCSSSGPSDPLTSAIVKEAPKSRNRGWI